MSKKTLIIILGICLLIAATLGYVAFYAKKTTPESVSPVTTQPKPQKSHTTPTKETPGVYVDYSSDAIANASGTKLLFFHASWCPQCRSIEDSIKKDGIPSGVTVIKVDYDSHQELRQKYGVTIQTTFVKIDDSGNKITSFVAYKEPTFASVQRELLP